MRAIFHPLSSFALVATFGATAAHAQTPASAPAVPEPPPLLEQTPPKEEAAKTGDDGIVGGYKDGLWVGTPDGNFKLKVGGLLQGRFELETPDMKPADTTSSFALRRAQLRLSGHAFSPRATFAFEAELGQGFPFLKDGFVNYAFVPGVLEVRVGQFKKPFSRIELTSDWKGAFLERAPENAFFQAGRDIGVAIHNDIAKSPALEWSVGVFSGTTDKPKLSGDVTVDPLNKATTQVQNGKLSNVPALLTPTFVGRLGFNFGDVKGYNELDLDGGPLRFGVAASAIESIDNGLHLQPGTTLAEVDGIMKWEHVDADAAVFLGLAQDGTSTFGRVFHGVGGHAQVGWLIAGLSHPALRVDVIRAAGDADDVTEVTLAHDLLLFGQNVQWDVDASQIWKETPGGTVPSWRVRTQIQLAF
jgi:hypothetical protein